MIEAVVWDIGNVLLEWQPERYYDRVYGPERRARLFAEVDLHGMNGQVDAGENFRDTVYAAAEANPAWSAEIRDWHDKWIELATPVIPGSVGLLRTLRSAGVPCFALSNFGVESFALAVTHYPFLDEFDRRFISGHLRLTKPDPRIYARVEEETGIAPGALLFTDDRADNIAAAADRGWRTHLFEGSEGFARRLADEGLLQGALA